MEESAQTDAVDEVAEATSFIESEIENAIGELELPDDVDDYSGEGTLDDMKPEEPRKDGDETTTEEVIDAMSEDAEVAAETQESADGESEGIRSLREANKQKAQQLKELQQKIAEYEANSTKEVQAKPPSEIDKMAEKYSAEDILSFLGRYEAGETDLPENEAADLKALALQALERKGQGEILDVLRKAQRGQYGEVSRDVQAVAAEALATASALAEVRKAENAATQQWQQQRNASLASVLAMEGMADETGKGFNTESELGKKYLSAGEELAQSIPGLAQLPHAPEIVQTYMNMKQKTLAYETEVPALKKENEELRARLKRFGGALPSGSTGRAGEKALSPEQELAQELRAQGLSF